MLVDNIFSCMLLKNVENRLIFKVLSSRIKRETFIYFVPWENAYNGRPIFIYFRALVALCALQSHYMHWWSALVFYSDCYEHAICRPTAVKLARESRSLEAAIHIDACVVCGLSWHAVSLYLYCVCLSQHIFSQYTGQ